MGVKLVIEVRAGIAPEEPLQELTRRWTWSGQDQDDLLAMPDTMRHQEAKRKWTLIHGESREYQASMENPKCFNWVSRDWLWL